MTPTIVDDGMGKCIEKDPADAGMWSAIFGDNTWHNVDGKKGLFCTITVKMKISGTVDYVMRTCPEPGLSVDACKGKYTTWDTVVLSTQHLDGVPYTTTMDLPYEDYKTKYDPKVVAGKFLWDILAGDFVKCFNNPGLNSSCAWAAATLIPVGKLADAAKGIVALRFAMETGVGLEDAKLALQATLKGYTSPVVDKLTAAADAVAKFRLSLKDGVGSDAALDALSKDPSVDRALVDELKAESDTARDLRTACGRNSFPAGTPVLMADGTTRPIEQVKIGDLVKATDPTTGVSSSQLVQNTIYTPDDRDFTELTVAAPDGTGSTITSTDHHPYWSQSAHAWRDAAALTTGDTLQTADGRTVRITGTRHWTTLQAAYNLTVSNVHTYYVLAGATPVLVHNSDTPEWCPAVFADLGNGSFMSPGGLLYAPGKIEHVLAHTAVNTSRATHTVFLEKNPIKVLDLVDDAWTFRSRAIRVPGDDAVWIVPMNDVIGTNGEKFIRLAINPGTNQILSAYPVMGP
ncbi:hypothetical protein C7C46_27970 [Streptomyces tateyamensis]|uniref:Intein C-terminal splicing domain-containing protein n=2 Tax=Streptomyces tateyamensis TaxID=565073 RepID=A0A2V4MYY8_9ACTN|nr:hypothetical protein C7C46_27970 [Streptomyces tateyamensis]